LGNLADFLASGTHLKFARAVMKFSGEAIEYEPNVLYFRNTGSTNAGELRWFYSVDTCCVWVVFRNLNLSRQDIRLMKEADVIFKTCELPSKPNYLQLCVMKVMSRLLHIVQSLTTVMFQLLNLKILWRQSKSLYILCSNVHPLQWIHQRIM
jgi:hypothetical protein